MSHLVVRLRLLALALLLAMVAIPATATATATVDVIDDADPEAEGPQDSGWASWQSIVGACLGILFGGALALWQIRGMQNRR